jgi:hypothetical protein
LPRKAPHRHLHKRLEGFGRVANGNAGRHGHLDRACRCDDRGPFDGTQKIAYDGHDTLDRRVGRDQREFLTAETADQP